MKEMKLRRGKRCRATTLYGAFFKEKKMKIKKILKHEQAYVGLAMEAFKKNRGTTSYLCYI